MQKKNMNGWGILGILWTIGYIVWCIWYTMDYLHQERRRHEIDTVFNPRVEKKYARKLEKKPAISMDELERLCVEDTNDKNAKKTIKDHQTYKDPKSNLTPKERFDRFLADYAAE